MSENILRLPAVLSKTGLKRATFYKLDNFPKPIRLSERTVGWIESEINQWLADRMAARSA
jgi:prophage regulatory protein